MKNHIIEKDTILSLSDHEIDTVDGGLLPLVFYFGAGAVLGAGVYLVTEYLT